MTLFNDVMPSGPSVEELQRILEKEFGRQVSVQEAQSVGVWLLRLYGSLSREGPASLLVGVDDIIKKHTT
jgi:hypothetical protein